MKKVVLRITGIDDLDSALKLEKAISKNKNIKSALADYKDKSITIKYKNISIKEIEEFIEQMGHKSLGVKILEKEKKMSLTPLIIIGIIIGIIIYNLIANTFLLPKTNFLSKSSENILLLVITIMLIVYNINNLWDGFKKIMLGRCNINSLVLITTIITLIYGIETIYLNNITTYLEALIVILYFQKIGEYIEQKRKIQTNAEIKQIATTNVRKVNKIVDDYHIEIELEDVEINDKIIVLPGDRISIDGKMSEGTSHFDEAPITGSSVPIEKRKNSHITSGSINCENEITYIVEKTVKDSFINRLKETLVEDLKKKQKGSKRIERFCNCFVPILFIGVMVIFILTWLQTNDMHIAFTKIVTTMLIFTSIGYVYITPLGFSKISKEASKKGLLMKSVTTLEKIRKIDTIVFDKTGTLTNGYLSISRINNHCDESDKRLLEILGSIEKHSNHPLAKGIIKYLRNEKIKPNIDFMTEDLIGYGVKAQEGNNVYYACNAELLEKLDVINSYKEEERKMKQEGNYVIYLVKNKKVIATFGLKDIIRKESKKVINLLKEKGFNIYLFSGDNEITTSKISKELEINNVISGLNCEEKKAFINSLNKEGKKVMVVGDGTNDALAFANASIGVALKSPNELALLSADVVLTTNNLFKILDIILLSKNTLKQIKQNICISLLSSIFFFSMSFGLIANIKPTPLWMIFGMMMNLLLILVNSKKAIIKEVVIPKRK